VPIKEVTPGTGDTNVDTGRTVKKMCEYIHAGAKDRTVQAWRNHALTKFAAPAWISEEQKACWSFWWLVKHAVKFQKDEPRLFEIGEPDALDLLIAPAVLVKMDKPAEDCDGFTMLLCSLLLIQGIKCYIVTVAVDPQNPDRWSHVFCLAELSDGTRLALDGSHGKFPGWMVPRNHIFRWQAWDLDGNPVDVLPPEQKTKLQGYTRSGVGYIDPETGLEVGSSLPTDMTPVSPSFDWSKLFTTLTNAGVKAYQTSQLPPNYFMDPNTGKLVFAPANVSGGAGYGYPFGQGSTFGSMLPILGIGLLAVVAVAAFSRGR
jgi:hypothetical protein